VDDWWQGLARGPVVCDFSASPDIRVPCRGQGYEGAVEGATAGRDWRRRVALSGGDERWQHGFGGGERRRGAVASGEDDGGGAGLEQGEFDLEHKWGFFLELTNGSRQ
jgi:hypothetical protein